MNQMPEVSVTMNAYPLLAISVVAAGLIGKLGEQVEELNPEFVKDGLVEIEFQGTPQQVSIDTFTRNITGLMSFLLDAIEQAESTEENIIPAP